MKAFLSWACVVLGGLVLIGLPSDNDLGWHLAIGRDIVATGQVPLTDSFSYSAFGTPWPAHSWFLDLVMYLFYQRLGYLGVALVLALIAGSAAWITVRRSQLSGWWQQILLSLTVVGVALTILGPRSQLVAWLGLSCILWYHSHNQKARVYSSQWHWLRGSGSLYLIVVFWIWANAHASVVLGLGFLYLVVGYQLLRSFSTVALKRSVVLLLSAAIVTLVNPVGIELWRFGLGIGTSETVRAFNQEWQSLLSTSFGSDTIWIRAGIVVTVLALLFTTPRSIDWMLLGLGLGLSLYSARFLLLIVAGLARPVSHHLNRFGKLGMLPAIMLISIMVWSQYSKWCGYSQVCWQQARGYSPELISALASLPDGTRIFNYYDWGGDLVWLFPEHKVFIDGRMDTFLIDGQPATYIYQHVLLARDGWQAFFTKYPADAVLLPQESPLLSLKSLGMETLISGARVLKASPSMPTIETPVSIQPQAKTP